jgi:hypothetical protein
MSAMEQLFTISNSAALVGWILLIAAPRWRWTHRLVVSGALSLLLSIVYFVLIVRFMPGAEGGFGSIREVAALFSSDALLLAGWVHYLAFDLMVGAIELRQAQEHGIPHLLLVPALIATFLLGPIGLLLFFAIKSARLRRVAPVTA